MKGLFIKDCKLMMLQKNFLLLILTIVIGMMVFTDDVLFPLVMMILIMEMHFCSHCLLLARIMSLKNMCLVYYLDV